MTLPNSMLLLEEASKIERMAYWKRYTEAIEAERWVARKDCWKKGEREYEKGMINAFDIILGYLDRDSLFNVLRESIRG